VIAAVGPLRHRAAAGWGPGHVVMAGENRSDAMPFSDQEFPAAWLVVMPPFLSTLAQREQ